jgi:peptide/nickel transport system permease protein
LPGEARTSKGARFDPQVLSLLDLWLKPLRERTERTYSAPFATRSFVKESVVQADGRVVREYPRLKYGGADLKDSDRRGFDILRRSLVGLLAAALTWGLLALALSWRLARRRGVSSGAGAADIFAGRTEIPWRAALATLAPLLAIVWVVGALAVEYHVLGTDKVGQDVLYQALKSVRTGLLIGTLTTLVMLPAAIGLGIVAGYFGGLADDLIQYLYTTLNSIPSVLLIAASILVLQVYMAEHPNRFEGLAERADLRLVFLCLILGVTSWTGLCRLLRGETLKIRESDYVQASLALGASPLAILRRHIVPNVLHIVIITVVLDFSGLVLAEAVLSYVNIGVDPTMNSWGNMINSARLELARDPPVWWSLAAAFVFMLVLVLSANLFADVVRDAFDPRLRGAE